MPTLDTTASGQIATGQIPEAAWQEHIRADELLARQWKKQPPPFPKGGA